MIASRKRLRVPRQLCLILVGGVAATGCEGSSVRDDAGAETSAEARPTEAGEMCSFKAPTGTYCTSVCYTDPTTTFACEVYCDQDDASKNAGVCYNADGGTNSDCNLGLLSDGGEQIFC